MVVTVCVRPYRFGDDLQIQSVVTEGTMITVMPFFWQAATREMTAQVVLMLSAVLFVVIGFPLHYSLAVVPAILLLLYIGIWTGHRLKASETHVDLNDIKTTYMTNPRTGFWVAEIIRPGHGKKDEEYHFVTVDELTETERANKVGSGEIIGTVAITIKNDLDMKDPPESVAWLRRMAVVKKHRKKGIGGKLVDVATQHCRDQEFRAVELITTESHDSARSLYMKKGFDLCNSYQKSFLTGFLTVGMYRFRKSCSPEGATPTSSIIDD